MLLVNQNPRRLSTLISNRHEIDFYVSRIEKLSKASKAALNHIIRVSFNQKRILYQAQETIGLHTSYCRRTINRAIKQLKALNLIECDSQGIFNTLVYRPAKILTDNPQEFKHLLNSLKSAVRAAITTVEEMVNVSPLKEYIFIKPCKYILQLLNKGRATVSRGMIYLKNREREIMDANAHISISPTLREITQQLRLTKLGQLKLLAFDDKVLSIVYKSLKLAKNIQSPFDWLVVACEQYSKANQVKVDWDLFYLMLKRYNVPNNKIYIQSEKQIAAPSIEGCSSTKEPAWKKYDLTKVAAGFEKFHEQRLINLGAE